MTLWNAPPNQFSHLLLEFEFAPNATLKSRARPANPFRKHKRLGCQKLRAPKSGSINSTKLPSPALPCLQCFQHANNEGRLSHRRRVAPWLRVASPSISVALVPRKFLPLNWLNIVWTILFKMQIHLALNIYVPTGSLLAFTMSWSTAKEHLTTLTHTSWITWFLFFAYLLKPHFCTEECSYPTFHGDTEIFLRFQSLRLCKQEW